MQVVIGKREIKYIQKVVGNFLYYYRAFDNTILVAFSEIAGALASTKHQYHEKSQANP